MSPVKINQLDERVHSFMREIEELSRSENLAEKHLATRLTSLALLVTEIGAIILASGEAGMIGLGASLNGIISILIMGSAYDTEDLKKMQNALPNGDAFLQSLMKVIKYIFGIFFSLSIGLFLPTENIKYHNALYIIPNRPDSLKLHN